MITDEWRGDTLVGREYRQHDTIEQSAGVYVSGDVHTNTIEVLGDREDRNKGNYHPVSRKWLQGYLNDFVWRYNRRYFRKENGRRIIVTTDRAMFLSLIDRATVDVER